MLQRAGCLQALEGIREVGAVPGTEVCREQGWAGVLSDIFRAWKGSPDRGACPLSPLTHTALGAPIFTTSTPIDVSVPAMA